MTISQHDLRKSKRKTTVTTVLDNNNHNAKVAKHPERVPRRTLTTHGKQHPPKLVTQSKKQQCNAIKKNNNMSHTNHAMRKKNPHTTMKSHQPINNREKQYETLFLWSSLEDTCFNTVWSEHLSSYYLAMFRPMRLSIFLCASAPERACAGAQSALRACCMRPAYPTALLGLHPDLHGCSSTRLWRLSPS